MKKKRDHVVLVKRRETPDDKHFPGFRHKVLTLASAFMVLEDLLAFLFQDMTTMKEAAFVQYWQGDLGWTQWLPVSENTQLIAGETFIDILFVLLTVGRIRLTLTNRNVVEINHAPFVEDGKALMWNKRLDQSKPRRKGIWKSAIGIGKAALEENRMNIRIPHA